MMRRAAVGAVLALVLALALVCGLGGAGARGVARLPDVDISLGTARLVARTSVIPYCSQLIGPDCISEERAPIERVYTAWLFIRTKQASWDGAEIRRILSLSLGHS